MKIYRDKAHSIGEKVFKGMSEMFHKLGKTKAYEGFMRFGKSNGVAKFLVSLIIGFAALVPAWIYFGVRWLVEPADFWQELAIIVVWGCIMGWLQVIMAVVGFFVIISIIAEP